MTLTLAMAATVVDVHAQSFQGGLRGTIKDSGGVIRGVAVMLINERTDVSRDTASNAIGEYAFPAVDPGTYRILAVIPGYRSFERKAVRINTQQFATLDITLEIGAVEETITVIGESPFIDTTNASTGSIIDANALESIPTAGRSVFLLANLEPTVQASGNAHWNRMQDQVGNSAVSMGGGAVRANNYLVNGFPVTDLQNRASTNPSMEAVQEMKVQVHTYDAEMGRTGGGVVNMTAASGYGVIRPESLVDQLLIAKLQNQPNVTEYWRDNGGGGGGPIVRNKTFFWFAGETYVDKQPQQNSFLVPTAAERNGDFSGLTRNGVPVIIKDPLTGVPFAGNVIPASRINPVGQKIVTYLPTADTQADNGSSNFSMTDLLPNKAYQYSTKVDHHFNEAASLSGFWLSQITHEANANYNPVNRFVGTSYQLDRQIKTLVVNSANVLGDSTVLTLRAGWNSFDDNYNLPFAFDATTLWPNNPTFTRQMSDTNRFPSTTTTGYFGTGFTTRQANGYYQYGLNGTLSKLAGTHNMKSGGDFRIIGVDSLNYGASTGSYTFTGAYSGNAMADMLLGYPQSGNIPLNTRVNGFVQYYSGYLQDDWRVSDRLTFNYGVRVERETGFAEKDNQITVNFDQTAVSPLNSQVRVVDPLTGQQRQVLGGLVFAGVDGAPTVQGHQPKYKVAPRGGVVFSLNDKTVLRGGYGVFWSPWNYPAAGTTGWGQIGYSATTLLQQPQGVPTVSFSDPFPNGLVKPTGNSRGLLTGSGGDIFFVDPNKGAPRVQQFSADVERELPGNVNLSVGYTGARGANLSWAGSNSGSTNGYININQIDPTYQSLISNTLTLVPNPFYGVADAGQFASRQTIEIGQLLRPFPQFGNVYMSQSTGAHSMYHAGIVQLRKRATGAWGGQISYTYSRLNDNQFAESNYYSSNAGLQNNYTVVAGSAYYNPDQEYGRSLLDSPHKLVVAPTLNLPFGDGRRFLSGGGLGDVLLGGWSVTTVITVQSGFPMGVTQNQTTTPFLFGGTLRPNIIAGQDFFTPGDITGRITANVNDNAYFNKAAFSTTPVNQFGNAPRMLPGVLSPWRNNVDLSVSKRVRTGGQTNVSARVEVLNVLNTVQWAAPASSAFGNSSFGQIRNQANNMRMMQFTFRFAF
ncbi:MAG: hypothetical protein AUH72_18300 [Acidobacteria bacterium 13_1_40CM_4_65_8]|nr:MAG: hypothetical protein AUH72_18300 [Acidobacteria bacterium 13_1_40CM_4_65_8]